jgi:hypothetical protein
VIGQVTLLLVGLAVMALALSRQSTQPPKS